MPAVAAGSAETGRRPARFGGQWLDTPVLDRRRLAAGSAIAGPAIIEETMSTLLVPPGAEAIVDASGNIVITLGALIAGAAGDGQGDGLMLPLSSLKVLDLTRVALRARPAVRQLADWGADCIKIEAPDEIDTGKGHGRRRWRGPDFQHRASQQARHYAEPEASGRARRLRRLSGAGGCGGGELPPRREDASRHRLRGAERHQSPHHPGVDLRVRAGRSQRLAPRLRPDRAGHGRADERPTGLPGQGPVRAGHPGRRSHHRHVLRHRIS